MDKHLQKIIQTFKKTLKKNIEFIELTKQITDDKDKETMLYGAINDLHTKLGRVKQMFK